MVTLDRAKRIRSTIQGYLNMAPSGMTQVPEIERNDATGQVRKLQVQVFALTDALVDTVAVVDELTARVEQLERRRR